MEYILLLASISAAIQSQVIIDSQIAYGFYGRTKQFSPLPKTFCCDNIYRFTYLQTYKQDQQATYNIIISLSTSYNITIKLLEGDLDGLNPSLSLSSCSNNCTVNVQNNCRQKTGYGKVQVIISGLQPMEYNIFCDNSVFNSPFQYGQLVITVVCFVQIVLAAHFQSAKAFDNRGLYLGYKTYSILCVCFISASLMIIFFANTHKDQIRIISQIFSFILGIFSVTVCTSEFIYWTGFQFLRWQLSFRRVVIRAMDLMGLAVGTYLLISWIKLDKNWIISDIIYTAMYFTVVKLVKFGSLKIAILVFSSIFIIFAMFIITDTEITHSYFNANILSYLNSPFFILFPTINYIPNQQCSWFFISSTVFPGMVLSYLVRFDYNRSTKVYTISFIFLFVVSSAVLAILDIFIPFVIPFELILSIIYMSFIMLFANRRGQLGSLWHGQIYDAMHKNREQLENQIKQIMDEKKKVRYSSNWLEIRMSNLSNPQTVFRPTELKRVRNYSKYAPGNDGL